MLLHHSVEQTGSTGNMKTQKKLLSKRNSSNGVSGSGGQVGQENMNADIGFLIGTPSGSRKRLDVKNQTSSTHHLDDNGGNGNMDYLLVKKRTSNVFKKRRL